MKSKKKAQIKLSGVDGNAFIVLGKFKRALQDFGHSSDKITEIINDATSGDYDHVLRVVFKWCDVS